MAYHETVSPEFVADLCDSYYTQAIAGRQNDARSYAIAVERAEHEWTKPEVELELSIRVTMEHLRRIAPDSVQFTEGY